MNDLTYDQLLEIPLEKRPSLYIYDGIPTFRTTLEKEKWMVEEMHRWKFGYLGMSPKHYFYLTQIHIKEGTAGKIIRPRWRSCDHFIFHCADDAEANREDLIVVKRREIGISSIFGTMPLYYIMTNPGCISGLTSCDTSRISNLFNQKLLVAYQNMHKMFKPAQENLNKSKAVSFLRVKLKKKSEEYIYESDVVCAETTDQPSSFSAYRLRYLFLDEFGLHRKRKEVMESADDSLGESGVREGTMVLAGTVENGIPQESLAEIQRILSLSSDDLKIEKKSVCFVPAWMGMYKYADFDNPKIKHEIPHTQNGWDNRDFSTQLVLKRREQYDKLEDKSKLIAYKKNHPLTIEDVIEAVGDGKLPADLADLVSKQITWILNNNPPVFNYDIEEDGDGKLVGKQNDRGLFKIYKLPVEHIRPGRYIAGNDTIPYGDAEVSDGSRDCFWVFDTENQEFVALILERNMDCHFMTEAKIRLQKFYSSSAHTTKNMMEMNRGEAVFQKYKDFGLLNMLAPKLQTFGLKESSRKWGYWRNDPKVVQAGNDLLFSYIRNHINKLMFKEACEQLLRFLLQNNDLVDGMIATLIYNEELRRKRARLSNQEDVETLTIPVRKFVNGKLMVVQQTFNVKKS